MPFVRISFLAFAALAAVACSSSVEGTGQPAGTPDAGSPSSDGVTEKGGSLPSNGASTKKDAGASKPPPSSTKTCGEAAVCASDCPDDGSDECVTECLSDLPEVEIAKLTDVAACIEGSGCGEDDDCVQETCAAEIEACIGG